MSLNVEISRYDYKHACTAVQNLLDAIESDDGMAKCLNVPSGIEIVDLVWDKIKNRLFKK